MIAASLLSVQGGSAIIGVFTMGALSDRIARKNVLALAHFIRGISFVTIFLIILVGGDSLWLLYIAVSLFGFGWWATGPLTTGLVADLFGSLRMGTILGVILSSHFLGNAISAYAGGAIFELTGSYYWAFLTIGLLSVLAVILSFFIKQKSPTLGNQEELNL